MPEQNTNRALTEAAADEWKVLPSGLTVLVFAFRHSVEFLSLIHI